jgi:O-antigen ligase
LSRPETQKDPIATLLELGLATGLVVVPWPLGAVGPRGRLLLESLAVVLLLLWLYRAVRRPTPLPPRLVSAGLAGLLGLAILQMLPLGSTVVALLSPRALDIREDSRPPEEALLAEGRMLSREATELDSLATLSLDPAATASALRTGAALAALCLVATTVARIRGARLLALALLVGAAFQGLYGLLVLASGHGRIWHLPKRLFLEVATGTFVNPNHFAGLLAASLPCGLALIHAHAGRRSAERPGLAAWLGGEGSRSWALGLLLIVAAAGLLLSYSRAGIAIGLAALGATHLAAGRRHGLHARLIAGVLVLAFALTPLLQIGAERLVLRYAHVPEELHGARVQVWLDTLALPLSYPVTGCGFGAFAASYPLVRSAEVRSFFAHAHNDPLQLLAEGGLLGSGLLLCILFPLLRQMVRALDGAKGRLAVGFATGLAAMMLHSLVDFPFHIPANAATGAVLAGVLFGSPWQAES